MNTEFATNVHTFTNSIVDLLFEQFEGRVLGGDGDDVLTKEDIMKSLFGDYKPDDSLELVVPKKSKKKKSSGSKKPRPLSGYTFFGKMSKEEINQEMVEVEKDTGEKPKYVSLVGKKWKALSDEEHEEWNHAAKGFELFIKGDSDNDVESWKALSGPEKKKWNKEALEGNGETVEDTPKKSKKTKKGSNKKDASDDEEE